MRPRRAPDERRACPACGPKARAPANRRRPVMAVWYDAPGRVTVYCHRYQACRVAPGLVPAAPPVSRTPARDTAELAAYLWQRSQPAGCSPVETYLGAVRGIDLPVPETIRYLPAHGPHPHAMIAAFGAADEVEPGRLAAPARVTAVHLTALAPDGRARLAKRMLGPVSGQPLMLAPPNDALGLVVTEGIEEALSVHVATGLGAWAAGSASHMGKLADAVPEWIDCVSVLVDHDPAGQRGAARLMDALRRRGLSAGPVTLGG